MRLLFVILLIAGVLTGCGGNNTATTDTASGGEADAAVIAVEQYLAAKVAGDDEALRPLLCAEKEADFQQEASSFDTVEASIEAMECSRDGDNTVRCTGQIVAVYGGEDTEFPLSAYRVVEEDGVWKWCGETE